MPRQRDPVHEYVLVYVKHGAYRGRYGIRHVKGRVNSIILFEDDTNSYEYVHSVDRDDMVVLTGDTDLFNLAKTIHAHMQEATNATTSTAV